MFLLDRHARREINLNAGQFGLCLHIVCSSNFIIDTVDGLPFSNGGLCWREYCYSL